MIVLLCLHEYSSAQFLKAPPDGENQQSVVIQRIGNIAEVKVNYSSPNVDGRDGKIWNQLVPFNQVWRAGANENTTITFSHDVRIENEKLSAGVYGLFMIPEKEEWTVIFSSNSTSWGTFVYNKEEDVLRIKVKPSQHQFTEWLTFDFIERNPSNCVLALKWENISLPIKIEFDIHSIVLNSFQKQLNGAIGLFNYEGALQAAKYCLDHEVSLEEGLEWIDLSISIGANFSNLVVKSNLLEKLGRVSESKKVYESALLLGTPQELYYHGRDLIAQKKLKEALSVFKYNYTKFGGEVWPTHLGLGRVYQAMNENKKALNHYEKALKIAKLPRQKKSLKKLIQEVSKNH